MAMLQRFLDPHVLGGIASLDLVAKTVVDGFISGLHRSPDFGFSQEFAEYKQYYPGDDLRHVDWNVFARSEKMFLKRFKGETNCQVSVLLDVSKSMNYGSPGNKTKIEYAKFLAASVCYLAHLQRDAAGLIVFNDEVRHFVAPSTRQGQLMRLLHGIDKAEAGGVRTDLSQPFKHLLDILRRRGMVACISDFWEDPENVIKTIAPLRFKGNEVVLFHLLDPQEIKPKLKGPALFEDLETGQQMEVSQDYAVNEYKPKIDAHIESLKSKARGQGMDYFLVDTSRPLDAALREYLAVRTGRL